MSSPSTAPARRPRADAVRNREALLAAARELFGERGAAATTEEVARRAGVGVGTLYRHFPTRLDLVEAVYREDVDGLVDLAEQLAGEQEPWAALEHWLQAFLRYVETKRAFLDELHEAFEKQPGLALAMRDRVWSAGGRVLARAQQAGAARPDLEGADLMQLVGGMCMAKGAVPEKNARLLEVVLDGVRVR